MKERKMINEIKQYYPFIENGYRAFYQLSDLLDVPAGTVWIATFKHYHEYHPFGYHYPTLHIRTIEKFTDIFKEIKKDKK